MIPKAPAQQTQRPSGLQTPLEGPRHCQMWWLVAMAGTAETAGHTQIISPPFTSEGRPYTGKLWSACHRGVIPGDLDASLANAPAAHDLADMAASLGDALPLALLLCCVVSAHRQRSALRQEYILA